MTFQTLLIPARRGGKRLTMAERVAGSLTPIGKAVIGRTPRKIALPARQIAGRMIASEAVAQFARAHPYLFDRVEMDTASHRHVMVYRLNALGNAVRDQLERD